ncbi:MAG: ADP-ribosylation factor-like protein [Candidatus Hodarchaeota archaeon]
MPVKVKSSARVLIIGPPNAGKSTIVSFLASKGDGFVKHPSKGVGVDITTFIFMGTNTSLIEVHSVHKEIINIYLAKTDGFIFIFDVNNVEEAKPIFADVINQLQSLPSGCLLILANKLDKLEESFDFSKYSQALNLEKLSAETDISWTLLPSSTKTKANEIFRGFEWLTSRIAQIRWDTGDLAHISLKAIYLVRKGIGVPFSVKVFDKTFLANLEDENTEARQATHLGGLLTAFSRMGETLFATSATNEIRFANFKLIFVTNELLLAVAVVNVNDSPLRTRIILRQLLNLIRDPGTDPIVGAVDGEFIEQFMKKKFPKDLPETV